MKLLWSDQLHQHTCELYYTMYCICPPGSIVMYTLTTWWIKKLESGCQEIYVRVYTKVSNLLISMYLWYIAMHVKIIVFMYSIRIYTVIVIENFIS